MPLSGDRKREYDRLWRQRKRSQGLLRVKRGSGGEKGSYQQPENVVPDVVPTESKQLLKQKAPSRRLLPVLVYTLQRRALQQEGRTAALERELLSTQQQLEALEKAYVQHQADHVVRESQEEYDPAS